MNIPAVIVAGDSLTWRDDSATAIVFGLTAFEIGAIGGLLVGIAGLIVNIYYKQQHLNIARKNQKADKDE